MQQIATMPTWPLQTCSLSDFVIIIIVIIKGQRLPTRFLTDNTCTCTTTITFDQIVKEELEEEGHSFSTKFKYKHSCIIKSHTDFSLNKGIRYFIC